jgi:hypothetical protein
LSCRVLRQVALVKLDINSHASLSSRSPAQDAEAAATAATAMTAAGFVTWLVAEMPVTQQQQQQLPSSGTYMSLSSSALHPGKPKMQMNLNKHN